MEIPKGLNFKGTQEEYDIEYKNMISWLRNFGFCLNTQDSYKEIRSRLKEIYPYEYYFYVDEEISKKAKSEGEKLNREDYEHFKKYSMAYNKVVRESKRKLIKNLYGLEKKGIR